MPRNTTLPRLFNVVLWMQEKEKPWCVKDLAMSFDVSYQTALAWKNAAEEIGLIRITKIAKQTTMWRRNEHRRISQGHIHKMPNAQTDMGTIG